MQFKRIEYNDIKKAMDFVVHSFLDMQNSKEAFYVWIQEEIIINSKNSREEHITNTIR
ncbi:MAG: hypothetical protein PHY47_07715 [Lachnospiraceae bacterium]|nr:hypothetical protein [Lachnospiraceae bacterium]